ncbi:MAG: D-alanyl-D-alanine carboxypeptidase [Desulfamplus sp.]|nr:D-alanyl-D-alanine carboxypeptidase [Desulfamplus sp.]
MKQEIFTVGKLKNMKQKSLKSVDIFCFTALYVYLLCAVVFLCLTFPAWASPAGAAGKTAGKKMPFSKNAGIMLCTENGTVLYSQNPDIKFIPASILKVLTSLGAIHYLGGDYRFKTDFFLDNEAINNKAINNKAINHDLSRSNHLEHNLKKTNLKIKGYGDPLFTSEHISQACHNLSKVFKSMNISELDDIIVDNTFFSSDIEIDGNANSNNPYDAFTGALSANFNTVFFKYSRETRDYISAEPQTPLLPFVRKRVQTSGLKEGRIILSKQESTMYAGMLIKHFLLQEGIRINGVVTKGIVATGDIAGIKGNREKKRGDRLVYTYTSPYSMDEIIKRLLKYSSNFMANQLFLSTGAKAFYPPATVEKGVSAIRDYARKVPGISDAVFAEGSGLSRQNRISPAAMIKVLRHFKKHYKLMQMQNNNTQNNNMQSNNTQIDRIQNDNMPNGISEYYKTGTLNSVRTRCGYFETSKGLYPFVIMINEDGMGYEKIRQFLWRIVSEHQNAFSR